jgi:general stress protein YciG
MNEQEVDKPKAKRGFAAMSPELRRDISGMGGRASHAAGSAREFSPAEARIAGSKGGKVTQARRLAAKQQGK